MAGDGNMCEMAEAETPIRALLAAAEARDDVEILANLRSLRNLCARGAHNQEAIANHEGLNALLHSVLFDGIAEGGWALQEDAVLTAWQLLANAIVNNTATQTAVWQRHGEAIAGSCATPPLGRCTDVQLMILYNIFKGASRVLAEQRALELIVRVWEAIIREKCDVNFDFLHFFFEHFLVQDGRSTVRSYAHLQPTERISFLDYVASYIRHDSPNGLVHVFLLHYIAKEFKLKSDCVMRQASADQVQQVQPREAYAILRVIACASGCEKYGHVFATDHSLFLNVSGLLRCLVAAGKEATRNMFTPMNKLEEVALTSNVARDYESEVSFELKTLLVRCVANLLYKNTTNQGYCLDTDVMPVLFECTNMDARNPLMKEWSILAIRNACVGCPENQQVIEDLNKQGTAPSDILAELNLEMGSLRITPNKDL